MRYLMLLLAQMLARTDAMAQIRSESFDYKNRLECIQNDYFGETLEIYGQTFYHLF